MAVLRGLREALVMYGIGLIGALLGAGIWTLVDDGDLGWRFGIFIFVSVPLVATGLLFTD